jgi:hypothetical protein
MMDASNTIHTTRHGPPPRQVGAAVLLLALAAGPLAWGLHLVLNYGFASQACFPGLTPRADAAGLDWLWTLLIAIDLIGMAGCALAVLLSWRNWREAPRHLPVDKEIETGAGRSRFLASWGMLTSGLFALAIVFDFLGLWVLPLC